MPAGNGTPGTARAPPGTGQDAEPPGRDLPQNVAPGTGPTALQAGLGPRRGIPRTGHPRPGPPDTPLGTGIFVLLGPDPEPRARSLPQLRDCPKTPCNQGPLSGDRGPPELGFSTVRDPHVSPQAGVPGVPVRGGPSRRVGVHRQRGLPPALPPRQQLHLDHHGTDPPKPRDTSRPPPAPPDPSRAILIPPKPLRFPPRVPRCPPGAGGQVVTLLCVPPVSLCATLQNQVVSPNPRRS